MSHELRTPLNAIIGFSEILAERLFGEPNEKQEEYLIVRTYASGQHLLSYWLEKAETEASHSPRKTRVTEATHPLIS
jgi:signal transduction histidine kinase